VQTIHANLRPFPSGTPIIAEITLMPPFSARSIC
jgi:hypothetical protein